MAATPSKPSPTSKPVQQSSALPEGHGGAIDPPCKETQTTGGPPPSTTTNDSNPQEQQDASGVLTELRVQPTYESSEQSDYFQTAKQLLSDGEFEQSLVVIQEALETTKTYLESCVALATPGDTAAVELHESLAPLHYLYGTTLLYSVEESTDSQQMTVAGQDASSGEQAAVPEDKGIGEIYADDMQIAFENLDVARTILELMLSKDVMSQVRKTKLQSALSQVLFREGDLQRLNGRYLEAIEDYENCLKLRQKVLGQEQFHSRQIASTFYNLGLTYLTSSSELIKQQSVVDQDQQESADGKNSMDAASRDKLSEEHRVKGIFCYLECAKVFCGIIALACGVDPQEIITGVRIGEDGVARAGLKTTGLDDRYRETKSSSKESLALSAMRRRVSGLTATAVGDNGINDLKQILDEIQETVDEAAVSQEAVRQASELKVQAQKAAAQSGPLEDTTGVTSTIGFGTPTITMNEKAPSAGLASDSKQPAAKPMMVIKKKKKREAPVEENSSAPAADITDGVVSKRTKTE